MNKVEEFHEGKSLAAVVFIGVIVGLFGLMMTLAGGRKVLSTGFQADAVFLLIFGLVLIAFIALYIRFARGPRISLTNDEFVLLKLLGRKRWKYNEINAISTYLKTVTPRSQRGRRMAPLTMNFMILDTLTGKHEFVLPRYGVGNSALLESLKKRTGITPIWLEPVVKN
jgi:hypothetical protein